MANSLPAPCSMFMWAKNDLTESANQADETIEKHRLISAPRGCGTKFWPA